LADEEKTQVSKSVKERDDHIRPCVASCIHSWGKKEREAVREREREREKEREAVCVRERERQTSSLSNKILDLPYAASPWLGSSSTCV
jgi:hypothetical protein